MSQYFLVFTGYKTLKLDKGFTEARVNELLGEKYKIEKAKNTTDQKRVYHFKGHGQSKQVYKLLIRGGLLEWIMKSDNN